MPYRALKSFIGPDGLRMRKGQESEINDQALADKLVKGGFVESLSANEKPAKKAKTNKNGGKDNAGNDHA